jgi:hypothetical protein
MVEDSDEKVHAVHYKQALRLRQEVDLLESGKSKSSKMVVACDCGAQRLNVIVSARVRPCTRRFPSITRKVRARTTLRSERGSLSRK